MDTTLSPGPEPARYDCSSIEVLEGLEAVRRRPGMYLGDVADWRALHSVALGLVDNALVEHRAGRCGRISVTIDGSGGITVDDDGPGIPDVLVHGESLLEWVVTRLHFGRVGSRYQTSLFGASLGVACAVAREMSVEVVRAGRARRVTCARGKLSGPPRIAPCNRPDGTRVVFVPDPLIFPSPDLDGARLLDELRDLAFLNPGLGVDFVDRRPGGRRECLRTRGLADWVGRMTEGQRGVPDEPLVCRGWARGIEVHAALRWTWTPVTRVSGFVGLRRAGGTHVWGLYAGIGAALRAAAAAAGTVRPRLGPARLGHGLTAVVRVEHPAPGWDQARFGIHDRAAREAVREVVARELGFVLDRRTAHAILDHVAESAGSP